MIGYFMALGCNSNLIANGNGTIELGSSEWNPIYVKIVD